MELYNASENFLAALKVASGGRVRLKLDVVQAQFLKTFPHFQGSADRRERLRVLLDELAAAGSVRLPANERNGWERVPTPALPKWILFPRRPAQSQEKFNHRSFPWMPELTFVASLRALRDPDEVRRIHEFLKNGGRQRPIVPVKERSYEIFGDEKRLDSLLNSQLFEEGRLTLEALRCRQVPASLPCVPASRDAKEPWLVLENESTFHSFCRLNRVVNQHYGIVLGSGLAVLRATEFLAGLLQPTSDGQAKHFLYFGDLDHDGIQIPFQLNQRLGNQFGIPVRPAERYYQWLLEARSIECPASVTERHSAAVTWFPSSMRERIRIALQQTRPVVQEAIGWEFLAAKFGIAGDVSF
ncbi:MAG: hypothetical protein ABS95_03775 [Verrucomicrobia bacterium SCN 57-15]|nr:MAG: hypothetical protein ABS95_03775 [Verrucomicrobia bacterium SCN 57-15]